VCCLQVADRFLGCMTPPQLLRTYIVAQAAPQQQRWIAHKVVAPHVAAEMPSMRPSEVQALVAMARRSAELDELWAPETVAALADRISSKQLRLAPDLRHTLALQLRSAGYALPHDLRVRHVPADSGAGARAGNAREARAGNAHGVRTENARGAREGNTTRARSVKPWYQLAENARALGTRRTRQRPA
jgi:hypothetical protein